MAWPLDIKQILEDLKSPASYASWRHNVRAIAQLVPNMYSGQYMKTIPISKESLAANTNEYFDVTGTGTLADPYYVKPKTTIFHGMNFYTIDSAPEPGSETYVFFQASGLDHCYLRINHAAAYTTYNYEVNVLDLDGAPRPRVRTPNNSVSRDAWYIAGILFSILIDLNSTAVYYSSAAISQINDINY